MEKETMEIAKFVVYVGAILGVAAVMVDKFIAFLAGL